LMEAAPPELMPEAQVTVKPVRKAKGRKSQG